MDFNFLFILLSIIVITILIVVHELGHFLAARFFGFQTPIFGIGLPFGPHIDLFKKWGTQFRFYWFLIGGFVSIPELGDETNPETIKQFKLEKSLQSFPVWQRAIVASGGIVFNVLFALLLTIVMAATIGIPKVVADNTVAGFVADNPVAKNAGLLEGDKITYVAGSEIKDGDDLRIAVRDHKGEQITVKVFRPDKVEETAAETKDVTGKFVDLTLTPSESGTIGIVLGYAQNYHKLGFDPIAWVWESTKFVAMTLVGMLFAVVNLLGAFFGKIFSVFIPQAAESAASLDQVKGIVGIIQLISEDLAKNWIMVFQFSILLSLNLAVINVLPIPALDGGHLMFMAYEAVVGQKASEKLQERAVQAGFIFLLTIIALTTVNDIKHWVFG